MAAAIVILAVLVIAWEVWAWRSDPSATELPELATFDQILDNVDGVPTRLEIEARCGPPNYEGLYATSGLADYRAPWFWHLFDPPGRVALFSGMAAAAIWFRGDPVLAWALLAPPLVVNVAGFLYAVRRLGVTGENSLYAAPKIELLSPIERVHAGLGDPTETAPSETGAGGVVHTFELSDYHRLEVTEWKGLVHTVTYWSSDPTPDMDLLCMFLRYAEGHEWRELTSGYLYMRSDGQRRLWCSAIPAVGVGTAEYLDSKQVGVAVNKDDTETS